jgi:hypothetical protein
MKHRPTTRDGHISQREARGMHCLILSRVAFVISSMSRLSAVHRQSRASGKVANTISASSSELSFAMMTPAAASSRSHRLHSEVGYVPNTAYLLSDKRENQRRIHQQDRKAVRS